MKELRQEQKAIAERLARLEGNFAGAAERIRLKVLNELLKAQVTQAGKKRPKSLPPKS
jgi:DNA-binding FrmR family transcriptional regulator